MASKRTSTTTAEYPSNLSSLVVGQEVVVLASIKE